jgi:predicted signal transduction protein with EAL and GGDEF domain
LSPRSCPVARAPRASPRAFWEGCPHPVVVGNVEHQIGVGIGIRLIPVDAGTADEALRRADFALSKAKTEGTSALRFFGDAMDRHVRERDMLEREFRHAFADRKSSLSSSLWSISKPTGSSVSRRSHAGPINLWDRSLRRGSSRSRRRGMIGSLTDQLLRVACEAACGWPEGIFLSFNISAVELRDRTLGPRILAILKQTGLAPSRFEDEITESALVRDNTWVWSGRVQKSSPR